MHMGKLGPPRQADQSEWPPTLDPLTDPDPNTPTTQVAILGLPPAVVLEYVLHCLIGQ